MDMFQKTRADATSGTKPENRIVGSVVFLLEINDPDCSDRQIIHENVLLQTSRFTNVLLPNPVRSDSVRTGSL